MVFMREEVVLPAGQWVKIGVCPFQLKEDAVLLANRKAFEQALALEKEYEEGHKKAEEDFKTGKRNRDESSDDFFTDFPKTKIS